MVQVQQFVGEAGDMAADIAHGGGECVRGLVRQGTQERLLRLQRDGGYLVPDRAAARQRSAAVAEKSFRIGKRVHP